MHITAAPPFIRESLTARCFPPQLSTDNLIRVADSAFCILRFVWISPHHLSPLTSPLTSNLYRARTREPGGSRTERIRRLEQPRLTSTECLRLLYIAALPHSAFIPLWRWQKLTWALAVLAPKRRHQNRWTEKTGPMCRDRTDFPIICPCGYQLGLVLMMDRWTDGLFRDRGGQIGSKSLYCSQSVRRDYGDGD